MMILYIIQIKVRKEFQEDNIKVIYYIWIIGQIVTVRNNLVHQFLIFLHIVLKSVVKNLRMRFSIKSW
jgi:hypothetical protein